MNEDLDRILSDADVAREVPEDLKDKLEGLIMKDERNSDKANLEDVLANLDAPRPLPDEARSKLVRAVAYPEAPRRSFIVPVAASLAVVLLAGVATMLNRNGGLTGPPATAVALRAFDSDGQFLGLVKTEALKMVGPYGYSGGGSSGAMQKGFRLLSRDESAPTAALGERVPSLDSAPGGAEGQAPAAGSGQVITGNPPPSPIPQLPQSAQKAPVPGQDESQANSATKGTDTFSGTNVQEKGVDEPDIVKTDGKVLVTLADGKLYVIDVTADSPKQLGSLALNPSRNRRSSHGAPDCMDCAISSFPVGGQEGTLLLHEDRVLHLTTTYSQKGERTVVTVIDIEDKSKPRIVTALEVEGAYVSSRMVDGKVRVVTRTSQLGPDLAQPQDGTPGETKRLEHENREIIRQSKVKDWIPTYVIRTPGEKPETGIIHPPEDMYYPERFAGLSAITVITLDPDDPKPSDAASVMGAGEIVYSSTTGMYVSTSQWGGPVAMMEGGARSSVVEPQEHKTQIHKFDISDPKRARYVASGEVPGSLLSQFSMSEHEGNLRVASTATDFTPRTTTQSLVTVLSEKDGKLNKIGQVGDLGRGEQIYSVRFIGGMGYVVTFRQTDPLYVLDLSDPKNPKLKGELKIPGFSNYLHPISETLLIGVGQAADEQGRTQGVQVSLFDVSDPAKPTRTHQRTIGGPGSSTEVQSDHHAFLYWPKTGLLVLPMTESDVTFSIPQPLPEGSRGKASSVPGYFVGAVALKVSADDGFGDPVRLKHFDKPGAETFDAIRRSMVLRNDLLTTSRAGILQSDLGTLAERTWLRFEG